MISVEAENGSIIYDSRSPQHAVLDLRATVSIEHAGSAQLILPPGHPSYRYLHPYKSALRIKRDDRTVFRGRVISISDDFYNRRTVTCEGERCMFWDAVMLPYRYTDTACNVILADILGKYNAQVPKSRQFQLGEVSGPSMAITMDSNSPEQIYTTIEKLQNAMGAYLIFTDSVLGRAVNIVETVGYRRNQTINFGKNLLDLNVSQNTPGYANIIYAYGAVDARTNRRITIESVNNGHPDIKDEKEIEKNGPVAKAITFDDCEDPATLKQLAELNLCKSKKMIYQLSVSAVDLSLLDKNVDEFRPGDAVRVISKPHGLDEEFLLTSREIDFLHPENDLITLGQEVTSMTESAATDNKNAAAAVERATASYKVGIAKVEDKMTSLIDQKAGGITFEVGKLESKVNASSERLTKVEQTAGSVEMTIKKIQEDGVHKVKTETGYLFDASGMTISKTGQEMRNKIDNTGMQIQRSGTNMLSATAKGVRARDLHAENYLIIGDNSRLEDYGNGRTACFVIGE